MTDVNLDVDDAPRTVEVPAALADALAAAQSAACAALSVGQQEAHALSVEGAKTDDTRDRRARTVIETLRG